MKVSLNAVKDLLNQFAENGFLKDEPSKNIVDRIGSQLAAVESSINFGDRFRGAVIVKILEVKDHPNADRLHLCKVEDGGKVHNVDRDENGHVQIVCGAPNLYVGMKAVWLPPGVTVPVTLETGEPLVMEAREIRGEVSNGMMASAKELTLGDNHEGILEITDDLQPGSDFDSSYNLVGDEILELENKMFTHRPDCFGMLGIAREIAGIYNHPFNSPGWYSFNKTSAYELSSDELPFTVKNDIPDLVKRFVAVSISNVGIRPSPLSVQIDLVRAGIRPINNIVDLTNIFMVNTGQPIHAYDYDKVKKLCGGGTVEIEVRHPKSGESIHLLNGKTISPSSNTMMVATNSQLICLGGAMGGSETEVDENSKNIIIEAATWDMYQMRRTSMEYGIFTDAVTRFTKGQSPLQNRAVVDELIKEIEKMSGGKQASDVIDDLHLDNEILETGSLFPSVAVDADFINKRLGLHIGAEEMSALLQNVEFKADLDGSKMTVSAPFWRTDIAIAEDLVEEVGRLYGYDKLPLDLPKKDIRPAERNDDLDLKSRVRTLLSSFGGNEVLTYSFVHGNLLKNVGQDSGKAFKVSNALSPELQYYRLSILPSLLDRVHQNIKAGNPVFSLFEMNKVHGKYEKDNDGLPAEYSRLALVQAADGKSASEYPGSPYYSAKKFLDDMFMESQLAAKYRLVPLSDTSVPLSPFAVEMLKPFEPNRSALVMFDGEVKGVVGEFRRSVKKTLKLPDSCSGFEIDLSVFKADAVSSYVRLPRFPYVEQDICLKVESYMAYSEVYELVLKAVDKKYPDERHFSVSPVDIFQRDDDKATKQITFRIKIASYEKTLTDKEVNLILDEVADMAAQQLKAVRI